MTLRTWEKVPVHLECLDCTWVIRHCEQKILEDACKGHWMLEHQHRIMAWCDSKPDIFVIKPARKNAVVRERFICKDKSGNDMSPNRIRMFRKIYSPGTR